MCVCVRACVDQMLPSQMLFVHLLAILSRKKYARILRFDVCRFSLIWHTHRESEDTDTLEPRRVKRNIFDFVASTNEKARKFCVRYSVLILLSCLVRDQELGVLELYVVESELRGRVVASRKEQRIILL